MRAVLGQLQELLGCVVLPTSPGHPVAHPPPNTRPNTLTHAGSNEVAHSSTLLARAVTESHPGANASADTATHPRAHPGSHHPAAHRRPRHPCPDDERTELGGPDSGADGADVVADEGADRQPE